MKVHAHYDDKTSSKRSWSTIAFITVLIVVGAWQCDSVSTQAQEQSAVAQGTSAADGLVAVPNRPSASTTAQPVQKGVFEIEYGTELADGHQDLNTLSKFGLARDFEVRFANNPFQHEEGVSGFGDSGAGFKYRALAPHEGSKLPALSVLYMYSSPTATHGVGAGSGGHTLQGLASFDLGKHHFDFNEGVQFLSRAGGTGYDHTYFTALSYSYPISKNWGCTEEVSGWSQLNSGTPSNLSLLSAVTWNVSPRLVLDSGVSVTGYGSLPRAVFFGGFTYSVVSLYPRR